MYSLNLTLIFSLQHMHSSYLLVMSAYAEISSYVMTQSTVFRQWVTMSLYRVTTIIYCCRKSIWSCTVAEFSSMLYKHTLITFADTFRYPYAYSWMDKSNLTKARLWPITETDLMTTHNAVWDGRRTALHNQKEEVLFGPLLLLSCLSGCPLNNYFTFTLC